MDDIYPLGPQSVPAELTRPNATYKQRAWLAVASLGLFVALYLLLAGWFVRTAYRVLGEAMNGGQGSFVNFLVGGGAAFLAVFMLKALFFIKKGDASDTVEVTAAEQPRLFDFLYRLADEAGAPRPRKVFLSPRVNAAVFYDLSVLNLLFPSRKNLEIGLALVNVLTLSEMKAVLAHEFGHFAQRSMAIGSWVYIARQIATQVIAKRDALDKFLQVISRIDIRVAWIGWLMSLVVWSIRSLMDSLLRLVVLAQRALSRQMEFQADLVAVSLTGSDELVNALHKLQAADDAWSQTLDFANSEVRNGRVPHDLFAVQARIIEKMAHILNDADYGRVPPASGAAQRVFKTSFAQPPQMWSTHPASADREENAKRQYLPAPHDARSAWLVFDDAEAVKEKVIGHMVREVEAARASADQTFKALEDRYDLLQYDPRYRGAYLGRSLTHHARAATELYEATGRTGVEAALASLYSARLGEDLAQLRELNEERAALQALHDKVYQATGGRIVHRGREIARRGLPAAIREVAEEAEQVRRRILEHDRNCRSAHLAAADLLGQGWPEYLKGLIAVLHYAEHTLADLRDAQGLLGNVVAIVTADGKVSSGELKRLLAAANALHAVLAAVHEQKSGVSLDASLCKRLEVEGWAAMLEEFKLPEAAKENINDWMNAIDGWVNAAAGALSAVRAAALEQLLGSESEVARHIAARTVPESAPEPSRTPAGYALLLEGQERKRQTKLDLWSRFQTADGVVPEVARLLVAGAIVGGVLGFGGTAAVISTLTVYNGLNRSVSVQAGDKQVTVAPFSAREIDVELQDNPVVSARGDDDAEIERFQPQLSGHSQHYVYNVAGASPMIEWTAVYGSAAEQPPRLLGAPRWFTSSVDVFFAEPPTSVKTKGGGATRTVLDGAGDRAAEQVLKALRTDEERRQVALAHAKWDKDDARGSEWRVMATGLTGSATGR